MKQGSDLLSEDLDLIRAQACHRDLAFDLFETVIKDTFVKNHIREDVYDWREELDHKKVCYDQAIEGHEDRAFFLILSGDRAIASIEVAPANQDICQGTNGALAHMMEVATVFVRPAYQFRGISRYLFARALKAIKALGRKDFCFDSGYPTAQKLWQARFGPPTYHLKDYWGPGADHMIWVRPIEDSEES